MLSQEALTRKEKIKLLSGKSGDEIAEKYGTRYVTMSDGPHGVRKHGVCYPNMCLMSCSWDPKLLFEMGECIGQDCIAEGIDVLLGPSVNIKRTPLCGRNFEYISEDPYLAGVLGAEYIRGIQSTGTSACVKHYCCYNQENNRFTQNVYVDEETLMNVYVRVFRIIIEKSSPDYLMTAYNNVNGEFMSENRKLIQNVLRELLGYRGIVITDWGGVDFRLKSILAGVDINMPGDKDTSWKEVEEKTRGSEDFDALLNESTKRVIAALEKATKPKSREKSADASVLRRMAAESMVLLKNEGLLPLGEKEEIAVIGKLATDPCFQGGGCAFVKGKSNCSPYEELCAHFCRELPFAEGYTEEVSENKSRAPEIAAKADKVLFFAGLLPDEESEGYDRTDIFLPEKQVSLLKQIYKVNRNVIVVLTNGSALDLTEVSKHCGAILECYYGGDQYAQACVDILTGKVNPCGRLAETFPCALSDCPSFKYGVDKNDTVVYKEGEDIGYKHYLSHHIRPRYAFGYGLSYTDFAYEDMAVSKESAWNEVQVEVTVRNTGKRAGKEVVQVYLQHREDAAPSLAGFTKVSLEPGESVRVKIPIESGCFERYNLHKKCYEKRSGEYLVSVRKDSEQVIFEKPLQISKKFVCTRYTKIDELRKIENGPLYIQKYFSSCIGMAVLGKPDYKLRFKGNEIDDEPFVRNVSYSMPLYIFTTLTAGMLNNAQLDEIIAKINQGVACT